MRSVAVWLVATLTAAVALSACSSSSQPGVLTQADIPSYLGVKPNQSESVSMRDVRAAPCKPADDVVFDSKETTVTSVALSCASVSQAQQYFNTIKVGANGYPVHGIKGHTLSGVGDEAWLVDVGSNDLRDYIVGWRQGDRVSLVMIEGPSTDKHITPALAKLLARRAAARS